MNRLVILLLVALAIVMFAASTEGIITFMTSFFFNCICLALRKVTTLHTAAAPAVRAAVKTELSYRNERHGNRHFLRSLKN